MSVDYVIHQGDNIKVLPTIPDSSIDLLLTDPPYGWSFMGKEWDKALPSPKTWPECYRVLKPGGSCVVMSGARLDCLWRMCRDLEAAGFELEQTALFWCYRSGFPKGGDLSKMADARAGAERKVVGEHPFAARRPNVRPGGGQIICQEGGDLATPTLTAPATPLAVALDGWFTKGKVKPAVEVIIWARKPTSEKTELDNMVKWGVGGVNCGECMIPSPDKQPSSVHYGRPNEHIDPDYIRGGWKASNRSEGYVTGSNPDRFPANLIVTDDALGMEDSRYFDIDRWAAEHGYSDDWALAAQAGVLQISKPSKAEKNAGCGELPLKSPAFGNDKGDGLGRGISNTRQDWTSSNNHPTVKPTNLFSFVISLLTKPNAHVLDPFCGSGTTLVAAMQTGRNAIGIELEPEYCTIARARADHALNRPHQKKPLPPEPKQQQALTLFN